MRLVTDADELQMVAAMQNARTGAANQIGGQWASAGSAGPDYSLLVTKAAPMMGGMAGSAAAAAPARRRVAMKDNGEMVEAEDDGFDWSAAGQGALSYGMSGASTGAAIGSAFTPVGALIGAGIGGAVGAIGGGLVGGFS
ncbi:MAG: hypothetical protein JRH14_11770 [Deltaproteobacteria bacterium]|nr:hypothetical protein [Deltaproteobacteria bacterium]MBW2422547.1 hypothetical protein [Deltaproteobacteria bacterium]